MNYSNINGSYFASSWQPGDYLALLSSCFHRAVWNTPLCWQRRPATRCTVARWCQSCCLSATMSRMSPTVWTACTVSTTITVRGTSSLHTLALFCPRDTTVHTSCPSSTAGEDSHTANCLCAAFSPSSFILYHLTDIMCRSFLIIFDSLWWNHTHILHSLFCRV